MTNIDIFFNPRSIAVIGASENPRKGGSIVIRNLLNFGYGGKIYPVNPKVGSMGGKILGIKAYDSILSIPKAPELSMYRKWYSAFEKRGIPVFPDPGRMVKAAAAIYKYAQYRRQI